MYNTLTAIGSHTVQAEIAALTAGLLKGAAVIIAGSGAEVTLGYVLQDYNSGERAIAVIAHSVVEVDAATGTYKIGDAVYDDPVTPTGVVDKVSTDRKFVGRVLADADLSGGAGKIRINFNGQEGAN